MADDELVTLLRDVRQRQGETAVHEASNRAALLAIAAANRSGATDAAWEHVFDRDLAAELTDELRRLLGPRKP